METNLIAILSTNVKRKQSFNEFQDRFRALSFQKHENMQPCNVNSISNMVISNKHAVHGLMYQHAFLTGSVHDQTSSRMQKIQDYMV